MSDDTRLAEENALLRVSPEIEAAGGSPKVLAAAVREYVRGASGEPEPAEILAYLKLEMPEAFRPPEPPKVELSDLSERERSEYITEHGLEAYMALIARDSQKRREDADRRRNRGGLQ